MLVISKKRAFDLVITLCSSIVWLPAVATCALLIWVSEGRPLFYVSKRRVGDQVRKVVKYRTMVRDAEKIYNRNTVPVSDDVRFLNVPDNSPLYTPIGRLIERYALTEIPQFLHVLQGYMSIIGNRPLPENVVHSLEERYPGASDRFLTPAGLTGPVQLIGKADLYDRERLMLEMVYCRAASLRYCWRLDLMILWYTVIIALRLRKPFALEEVQEMIVRVSGIEFSYPESLRRREDDEGIPRESVWTEEQRQAHQGDADSSEDTRQQSSCNQ